MLLIALLIVLLLVVLETGRLVPDWTRNTIVAINATIVEELKRDDAVMIGDERCLKERLFLPCVEKSSHRAQFHAMFQQSSRVAWLQWVKFRDELFRTPTSTSTTTLPVSIEIPADKHNSDTIHDALYELNTLRFHLDLFSAAARDPLSTLFSAVWTLCSSMPPPRQLVVDRDTKADFKAHYTSNWYPLLLLLRYAKQVRSNSRDERDLELFTIEQLVAADKQYLASFDEYNSLREFPDRARELYLHYENEYLTSPELEEMAQATPFGTAERKGKRTVAYTSNLIDVADRRKLGNLFYRIRAYQELRLSAERKLRSSFGSRVRLDQWILAMQRSDEENVDVAGATNWTRSASDTQYLMIWQYQKSHLVWFVLHCLFALNELVADDELTLDLLYFVAHCLERFVECSVCQSHWLDGEQKSVAAYEQQYVLAQKRWSSRSTPTTARESSSQIAVMKDETGTSFTRVQSILDPIILSPSLYAIHVHNRIQSENVSPIKRLTRACLRGIQADYVSFATALVARMRKRVDGDDDTHEDNGRRVHTDSIVVERPEDVFANEMLRGIALTTDTVVVKKCNKTECDLEAERNAYRSLIYGNVNV